MFRRIAAIGLVIALMPLGCMLDESTHVIFLESDGTVTWRVFQDLIRSDKDRVRSRAVEEDEFLEGVDDETDDLTDMFVDLQAEEVDSWFVRHSRPYTRVVEARFDGLDHATQALIDHGEADADVDLVRDGERLHYTLRIVPQQAEDDGDEESWQWASHHVRLALAEGRFVQSRGFELSEDGAVAVPRALSTEELDEFDGVHVYELVWEPRA